MNHKLLVGAMLGVSVMIGTAFPRTAHACPQSRSLIAPYVSVAESLASDKQDAAAATLLVKAAKSLASKPGCAAVAREFADAGARIFAAKDIAGAREGLKSLDGAVMALYKAIKPTDVDIAYCPMIKAHWLQKTGAIRNPYYGSSMLECGLVVNKKVLEGRGQ